MFSSLRTFAYHFKILKALILKQLSSYIYVLGQYGKLLCSCECVNYSAKSNGISYHKLPRDTRRQKAWLERIRRTNMPPLENCYVCSEHFSAESFEVNLCAQITGVKCKQRLKEDAIPLEFCFHPPAKRPRLCSETRLRRRSHEEVSVFLFIVLQE